MFPMLPRCLSENIEHARYKHLPDEYTACYHKILICYFILFLPLFFLIWTLLTLLLWSLFSLENVNNFPFDYPLFNFKIIF